MGIYGSIVGIIIPFIINIRVYVYLYQLCFYVPNDLMEAGRIDGATEFKIMKDISIPVIKDKIIFSFFMLFVSSWNNFFNTDDYDIERQKLYFTCFDIIFSRPIEL